MSQVHVFKSHVFMHSVSANIVRALREIDYFYTLAYISQWITTILIPHRQSLGAAHPPRS